MSSTISTGIRIPKKLYEIARAANPDKTFSEIVKCALEERFGFTCNNSRNDEHESSDVEDIVDNLIKLKHVHQNEGRYRLNESWC